MSPLSALARRMLRHRIEKLHHGQLTLVEDGKCETFGTSESIKATIDVLDQRFYRAVAFGGAVGAGESFAEGWWRTPDLTSVVRLMVRNRAALDSLEKGMASFIQPVRRLGHALRKNTLSGSRRNISAHYDLGNDFFELFLDETLTYSCGIFNSPEASLFDASIEKYDRIATLLELGPKDHVVEIGTGWGGFAIHVARKYGCRVTTTTISDRQHSKASELVAEAGLSHQITLLKQDYRSLEGEYDKLVSIEMIEAVGHEHFGVYFEACSRLLKGSGRAVIQAITIANEQYESARNEVDFIKRHIFPGSCIPSEEILRKHSKAAGLQIVGVDEIGLHYAETLRRWDKRMRSQSERLLELGYDQRFQRLWEFYFAYCEGGFLEQAIGNLQITFVHEGVEYNQPVVKPVPELEEAA